MWYFSDLRKSRVSCQESSSSRTTHNETESAKNTIKETMVLSSRQVHEKLGRSAPRKQNHRFYNSTRGTELWGGVSNLQPSETEKFPRRTTRVVVCASGDEVCKQNAMWHISEAFVLNRQTLTPSGRETAGSDPGCAGPDIWATNIFRYQGPVMGRLREIQIPGAMVPIRPSIQSGGTARHSTENS